MASTPLQVSTSVVRRNKIKTFFSKPYNVILVLMGLVLTVTTVAPIVAIVEDTFKIHPGTIDAHLTGQVSGYTLVNYIDLFTSSLARTNLWEPLWNTVLLAVGTCVVSILFGGLFAFLITRTNLAWRKYLSSIFIFPYIMPQWTLAVVWQHMFNSNAVTGTSNGLLAATLGIEMPAWWCLGLFPSVVVLGLHYAPFAYILIGGIFRNMDANLEEAATILDTPKWKIMFRVTLPMVKPAILSTILLVFGSSMGSYPVPHYLNLTTLATKYVSMNSKYTGEASILAIIMMIFGVAIMLLNQLSLQSRKNYTTVTGKSGQISKINLGRVGKYVIALVLVVVTFFTSIFPIVSFAFETFLPNPGDYSFLYTGDTDNLTTKWWVTDENITENGMYGQKGILHNDTIWRAFKGTIWVSVCCSLLAGTIGTMIGYAVSKNRRSKLANYVNSVAFLPYLMPSIAVGVAFFILFSNQYINLFNTYTLLIIVGTIKYIPFASRSSLNSMLQLSGEIEESAMILNIPWVKRMTRIIIPIQKSSIISGYLLPFMTCLRELSLFMLLCTQGFILATTLDYFDEMGLYAFSSGINLILIITILVCNTLVNKITGASLDKGIGG
ncbi:MAG TPA: iron ABC transporter permease [Candidatus Enterenecus stercoripullorum]|uniref:ABC transporter permease n=1 Tax=Pseudoflavonifractor sp. An184 TaxID=1965576 RepID=UPI000B378E08|nr:iron ABC transporter permease [Pseudoflavonifractor sp. An184]MBS5549049.1 iron ABC transporter permease [Oscillospiraceae bacterium]OUP56017.1 ABC transporter permease [Pseudoflavonifractor sp. An184]HIT31379.1 iron ABC transporter permease [Candidatus Enterenecus stercoripullorum]